jgi:hypothetical protein
MYNTQIKQGEKRMRRAALLTASVIGLGLATIASAAPQQTFQGFVLDNRRIVGTGTMAGFDIVQFFVRNTGTGLQTGTTKLLATDLTVMSNNDQLNPSAAGVAARLKFDFRDIDQSDTVGDANILGAGLAPAGTGLQGSYVRIGALGSVTVPPGDAGFDPAPPARLSDNNGDSEPDNDPAAKFANLKSFRVVLFNTAAPDATSASNGGLGAFLAEAVVPTGVAAPRIVGGISAEQGASVPIDYTAPIPEPTTLTVLGLGAMGLLGRRRRA